MTVNKIGDPFSGRIKDSLKSRPGAGRLMGPGTAFDAVVNAKMRAESGGGGLKECAVSNLTFAAADFSKVYVQEGFSVKAKAYLKEGKVYLEQKLEDGTVKAYEADPQRIAKDTADVMEMAAVRAWERARKAEKSEAEWFHGEVCSFYERVKEQIKNGPPKIQTGGSEFSVKEWEKLLEEIDDYLDEVREEQRVRSETEQRNPDRRNEAATAMPAASGNDGTGGIQLARALEQQALLLKEKLCERVVSNGKDEEEAETTSRVIVKNDGAKVLEVVTDTGGMEWKMYVEIEKGDEEE